MENKEINPEELAKRSRNLFLHCTINYNYPTTIVPLPGPKDLKNGENDFSEEDMAKLISFIKDKIDIPLPNDLIRNILDAEFEYFNGR